MCEGFKKVCVAGSSFVCCTYNYSTSLFFLVKQVKFTVYPTYCKITLSMIRASKRLMNVGTIRIAEGITKNKVSMC